MFALAYELKPQKRGGGVWDVPSAYPAQALVGTLTIPAAFLLAYLVAGRGAGLLAAAAVAVLPAAHLGVGRPALRAARRAPASPRRSRRPSGRCEDPPSWLPPIAAGLLLGATILTRADLALVPAIALLVVAVAAWRRASSRPLAAAVRAAGPMLVALLVLLTPWTVFASSKAGHFVPLSSGGGSNLWVGTYLPGNGSMFGAKRALADEVRARNPELAGKKWFQLRQADVIATVAARHPDLTTDAALQKEGMQNLRDYALGDPVSFAAMGARKVWRLWGGYTLGTYRNPRTPVTVFHLLLVAFGLVGLVAGFVATRGAAAMWLLGGVLLYVSAINALLVSEARHNLTLMPIVVATGAAGRVPRGRAVAGATRGVTRARGRGADERGR